MIRRALTHDIPKLFEIEKRHYKEFAVPESVLFEWVQTGNVFVVAEGLEIFGFVFYEFLSKIVALPRVHSPLHQENKNYVYISEIVADSQQALQELFEVLMKAARINRCQGIIWLASNRTPDIVDFLAQNKFKKHEHAKNWERLPGIFVDDFYVWVRELF